MDAVPQEKMGSSAAASRGNHVVLGAVGAKALHAAGFLAIAERLLAGDFLCDEDIRSLGSRAQPPVLAKLISIVRSAQGDIWPKEIRLRPVMLVNLAAALESGGAASAIDEFNKRIEAVDTAGYSSEVFIALDRWTGDFDVEELAGLLSDLQGERLRERGLRILGPSTPEIKTLINGRGLRRVAGGGAAEVLQLLKDAGIKCVEGGGDLNIHRVALNCGFSVSIGQRVDFEESGNNSGVTTLPMKFIEELLQIRRELVHSGRVTSWFPWAVDSSGTQLISAIAVGRLALQSVPRIRAPLSLLGPNLAQAALEFGANDIGFAAVDSYTAEGLGISPFSELEFLELEATQLGESGCAVE